MKRMPRFLCLFFVVWMTACNPKSNHLQDRDLPIHIDLTNLTKKNLYLSDIADSVWYIPLETCPDFYIGDFAEVQACPDGYIIRSFDQPLGYFSEEGQFIRSLGRLGAGPGEYQYANRVFIDHESRTVISPKGNEQPTFYEYDLDGNLLNTIQHKAFGRGHTLKFWHKVFIAPRFLELRDDSFVAYTVIEKGGVQSYELEIPIPPSIEQVERTPQVQLHAYNGALYLINLYRDTIFQFEDPQHLSPYAVLNRGPVLLDFEKRFGRRTYNEPDPDKYIYYFKERGAAILMAVNAEPEPISVFYEVMNHACYQFENNGLQIEDMPFGIENDLDGGPIFYFHHTTHESYGYSTVQAIDLFQWKNEGYFDHLEAKHPQKKAQLLAMIDTLTIEDNPVIMKVKFKSGKKAHQSR